MQVYMDMAECALNGEFLCTAISQEVCKGKRLADFLINPGDAAYKVIASFNGQGSKSFYSLTPEEQCLYILFIMHSES